MILLRRDEFVDGCSPRRCAARRRRRSPQDAPDQTSAAVSRRRQSRGGRSLHPRPPRLRGRSVGLLADRSPTSGAAATPSAATTKPIALDDYVLTQPPIYTGPPRPPGYVPPQRDPAQPALPIPGIADFLTGRRRAIQFRAGPAEDRSRVQAGLRQGRRRPPASPGIRRSASMPSRPAATAPMTDRPASSATARTRGRSRRRWATTSC